MTRNQICEDILKNHSKNKLKESTKHLKEDVWDDIADIERGGFDEFRDDEYENADRARYVHDAANAAGMSDLDYVNMEDLFDNDPDLEDVESGSFSEFLVDDEGNPGLEDAKVIFDNLYSGNYKGMYDGDYAGDAEACLIDVIEGYNQSAWEAQVPLKGVRMFATNRMRGFYNDVTEYEARLQYLAQYKDNPKCVRCKQYFNALATYARQINEIADEYNLPKYKITIPEEGLTESVNKKLQESEKYSIDDIVMSYSTWSGTDMKRSTECCAEELREYGYSLAQVKEYFDSDGYRTEENPDGCWDPEFANKVLVYLMSLEELNGPVDSEDLTEENAVAAAFPNASPHTVDIIARWYRNEGAVEDFTDVDEFAEYIKGDFMTMFWAGDYNNAEFHEVATDMINAGYFEADDFPYDEGLTESKKKNLKEAYFLGNEIDAEKPFSDDWTKWVQKCQRWLDKEQLRGNHDEDFYDLLSAVGEELGSYHSSARLKTPRQDYIKGLAKKGYRKAQEFLQKFPEPEKYATGEVKEEEPVKMYALFTDGGNAYSAGRGADWYWASSDCDESEKDFKARVRYSAKRKAEKKYYEYDPRCLKCKFFKSLDAFKREAAKVGINPDLTESKKKAIKEEVWEDEEYVDGIIEKFCILMDWEIKPEDIQAVAETCGKYIMHLRNGDSFTYDPENDCIVD